MSVDRRRPNDRQPGLILLAIFSIHIHFASSSLYPSDTEGIDFPPQLDADDIRYYSENHDIDGLHWALSNVFQRSSRNPIKSDTLHELPETIVSRGGGSSYTTKYKMKMDLEQAEFLAEVLKRTDEKKAAYFRDTVAPTYRTVLEGIPELGELERTQGLYGFRPADLEVGIMDIYNKALHHTDFDELTDDKGRPVELLSESFNATKIEREWFNEVAQGRPGIVVIDDVLSPLALERIRTILLQSTVFYQTKMPLRFGGYAGAYIDDGLHDRILLALAFEFNKALPRIMKNAPLRYLWAYRYDSDYNGIATHADEAAVNLNIWLTPDEANIDKDHGGLVIFTAKPPPDADFTAYNTNTEKLVEEVIKPTGYSNVTVPFRYNRAVMVSAL